jgi:hypothetical protein
MIKTARSRHDTVFAVKSIALREFKKSGSTTLGGANTTRFNKCLTDRIEVLSCFMAPSSTRDADPSLKIGFNQPTKSQSRQYNETDSNNQELRTSPHVPSCKNIHNVTFYDIDIQVPRE